MLHPETRNGLGWAKIQTLKVCRMEGETRSQSLGLEQRTLHFWFVNNYEGLVCIWECILHWLTFKTKFMEEQPSSFPTKCQLMFCLCLLSHHEHSAECTWKLSWYNAVAKQVGPDFRSDAYGLSLDVSWIHWKMKYNFLSVPRVALAGKLNIWLRVDLFKLCGWGLLDCSKVNSLLPSKKRQVCQL